MPQELLLAIEQHLAQCHGTSKFFARRQRARRVHWLAVGVAIAPPVVISTGDPVLLTWAQGGVHLEREGVAMQPARLGEQVRVRAGTQQIAGLAVAPDTARVVRRP